MKKVKLYQKGVILRKEGKSYREIAKLLGVAKSTVSLWCKGVVLPARAKRILERKSNQPWELFRKYNQKRSLAVTNENKNIEYDAAKEIRFPSRYDLILLGAALYWGEGYKKQKGRSPYVGFSNSDPRMVQLFLRFLYEVLHVSRERIKCNIRVFPATKGNAFLNFWSNATKLPKNQFRISRYVSKSSKGKRPFNTLPNGTLSVRVHDRKLFFRIKGYITGLESFTGKLPVRKSIMI